MKILHLMLGCFYIDNYSYQENCLPKYHKKQGHDVEIVSSLFTFDDNGKGMFLPAASKYTNEHGIPVTRLAYSKSPVNKRLKSYVGLYEELERVAPDIIFIHGVQFCDISRVCKYCKKHKGVTVYVDNHADFANSAKNWVSKNILHKIIWRRCAHKINRYAKKFYGVIPSRVDFLVDVYKLPREKVELLVMGADDEMVEAASDPAVAQELRRKYGVDEKDFVVMTGGKIDHNKPQTLILMEAINSLGDDSIKLLVFGSVAPEYKTRFEALLSDRVKYIGWKKSDDIYKEYAAADLIAFPGLHSVLWEQAVGMGKPCVFRHMDGFTHIDLSGNCMYFQEDTSDGYARTIKEAIHKIDSLKQVASEKGLSTFSYNKIAERSIGVHK